MDYYLLTDLAAQVGHGLAISGAETFRVEDTIRRILRAYGIECEVFAIPNCLTISFEAANGNGDRVVPVSTADYYASADGALGARPVQARGCRLPHARLGGRAGGVHQDALAAINFSRVKAAVL